jgi:hypothetical protein
VTLLQVDRIEAQFGSAKFPIVYENCWLRFLTSL